MIKQIKPNVVIDPGRSAEPSSTSCVWFRTCAFRTGWGLGTFSNSQGSNACMAPFGKRTAIVVPVPITRSRSRPEWWRTQSLSRNSCSIAVTRSSKRLQSRPGASWDAHAIKAVGRRLEIVTSKTVPPTLLARADEVIE